jgi:hypothetical protein
MPLALLESVKAQKATRQKHWADRHLDASMIFPEIIPFHALPTQIVPSPLREQSITLEPRKGLTVQAHKGFTGFRAYAGLRRLPSATHRNSCFDAGCLRTDGVGRINKR